MPNLKRRSSKTARFKSKAIVCWPKDLERPLDAGVLDVVSFDKDGFTVSCTGDGDTVIGVYVEIPESKEGM